jgi:hypothetical protein
MAYKKKMSQPEYMAMDIRIQCVLCEWVGKTDYMLSVKQNRNGFSFLFVDIYHVLTVHQHAFLFKKNMSIFNLRYLHSAACLLATLCKKIVAMECGYFCVDLLFDNNGLIPIKNGFCYRVTNESQRDSRLLGAIDTIRAWDTHTTSSQQYGAILFVDQNLPYSLKVVYNERFGNIRLDWIAIPKAHWPICFFLEKAEDFCYVAKTTNCDKKDHSDRIYRMMAYAPRCIIL